MQIVYPTGTWHGFSSGQLVAMEIETRGATANDEEVTHPIGTHAKIEAVVYLGNYQGYGVHITIGEGDSTICNTFDDRDILELGRVPFV